MSLWAEFLTNKGRPIYKWKHYFPAYESHFGRYVNRPMKFLEIGCGAGGSLQMWKRYFGPHAMIVGIDIRPGCKAFEEDQIAVRIGNQADPDFLNAVVNEFGAFDVVLDDGSHMMEDIAASFAFLYPRTAQDGIYMVEDLVTAYMEEYGGGLRRPGTFIEFCKDMIDELNGDWLNGRWAGPEDSPSEFTRTTQSMHFYDGIVAFERGRTLQKGPLMIPPPEQSPDA
jgi:23S rRNA U2552 (ribose-2'-O)-methylase RlmE/FtsJ